MSNGGILLDAVIEDSSFEKKPVQLTIAGLSAMVWPSSGSDGYLYFQGRGVKEGAGIFRLLPDDEDGEVTPVVAGILPSISPSGRYLSFFRIRHKTKRLLVIHVESGRTLVDLSGVGAVQPTVWISDQQMMLNLDDRKLVSLNVSTGEISDLNNPGLVPGAASPDRTKVLCGTYDGKRVYLLDSASGEVRPLIETYFTTVGTNFVWSNNGRAFLYSRQSIKNLVQLRESRDLFLHGVDGDLKLISDLSLFGGVSHQCRPGSVEKSDASDP